MDMQTFSTKADAKAFQAFAKDHANVTNTKLVKLADCFLVIVYTT